MSQVSGLLFASYFISHNADHDFFVCKVVYKSHTCLEAKLIMCACVRACVRVCVQLGAVKLVLWRHHDHGQKFATGS